MGKLSKALEKAGLGEASEVLAQDEMQPDAEGIAGVKASLQEVAEAEIPESDTNGVDKPALQEGEIGVEASLADTQKTAVRPVSTVVDERPVAASQPSGGVMAGRWDPRLVKAVSEDLHLPEVFKTLRSRILFPAGEGEVPRTVLVTSALPKEGKSFVSANLAISMALGMEQHALLVDCDLRRPSLSSLFGVDGGLGVADHLQNETPLERLLQKTSINKLSLLPSGKPPMNPAELLSSARMERLLYELSTRYVDRIVIFDTPPTIAAAETSVLAGLVDAIVLVVREARASRDQLERTIELLGRKKLLGVVYNDHTSNLFEKSVMKGYRYDQQGYYRN